MSRHRLDIEDIYVLSRAEQMARYLLENGLRHPYGLYPRVPLVGAERRDFETLTRVLGRIFERDSQRR